MNNFNLKYEKKKKIRLIAIISLIVVLNALLILVFATNSGNESNEVALADNLEHQTTVPDGYTAITNATELAGISSDLAGKYILMNDIDLSSVANFGVIGRSSSLPFKGKFDGNNYTISNLNIESNNQYVGLFGYVKNGTIKDLTIENATVKSTYLSSSVANGAYVGVLAGYVDNATIKIENISVIGESKVEHVEEILKCVGGLIGEIHGGTISGSNSNVNITVDNGSYAHVGGLIGRVYSNSTINTSYATGEITANSTTGTMYVGGLVGQLCSNSTINTSYATGAIVATSTSGRIGAGGLVALNTSGTITNAYATGNVNTNTEGLNYRGGLVGDNTSGTITNTYAVGKVSGNVANKIGGLVGNNTSGTITASYWSPEAAEVSTSSNGTALLFQKMLYKDTYSGWGIATDDTGIWKIKEGETLPYLVGMNKPDAVNKTNYADRYIEYEGEGTKDNPFIITTEAQLQGMKNNLSAHYKLGNNITLTKNFEPIGPDETYPFKGTLDGAGFTISNMNIVSDNQYVGMFGYLYEATIKNLTLENQTVKSTYLWTNRYKTEKLTACIGGIAGRVPYVNNIKDTNIENVHIIGESSIEYIQETNGINGVSVGGFIGDSYGVNIVNSSTKGDIIVTLSGHGLHAGGLVGEDTLKGTRIQQSYSEGNITVNSLNTSATGTPPGGGSGTAVYTANVGGLVGYGGIIEQSHATGNIIVNSSGEGINVGGLVGYTAAGKINQSYATGNVEANLTAENTMYAAVNIGGLVGDGNEVQESYATGDVTVNSTGTIRAGGLAGYLVSVKINDLYATGNVTAKSEDAWIHAGALVGYVNSSSAGKTNIKNAYAVGKVDAETEGTKYVGGLAGYSVNGIAINSYWSPKSTGQETSVLGEARTIQELLYRSGYADTWDFSNVWTIEPNGGSLAYLKNVPRSDRVLVENLPYETRIPVKKEDNKGNPLSGAKFIIKDETGAVVREGSSNNNGIFYAFDLDEGTYTLQEIQAPDSYVKDNTEYTFRFTSDAKILDVTTGSEINLKVINDELKVTLKNVDSSTKAGISGAQIGLFDVYGNAILGKDGQQIKGTTDTEGNVVLTNVPVGTYKYKQISAATGYKIDTEGYNVTIAEDGTVTFEEEKSGIIENERITGNITITKTGEIKGCDETILLEGAKIALYDSRGRIIEEKITNEDAQVTFESLGVGTYTYREIEAPEGYEVNTTGYTFTVNADGTISDENGGTIYNNQKRGTIVVRKYAASTHTPLRGAVIGLFDEDGNKVYDREGNFIKKTTNSQGYAVFTGLNAGVYKYRELSAPTGYKNNNNMYKVTINDDWTVQYETDYGKIYDARWGTGSTGEVPKVSVTTHDPRKPGDDTPIYIYDKDGNKILDENGDPVVGIPTGDGNIIFPELEPGEYIPGIPGDPKPPIKIVVDDDGTFNLYTDVTIIKKVLGTDEVLSGVKIGLYKEGTTETKVGETEETNENGKVTFLQLSAGRYYYIEEETVSGYKLNTAKHYFTVGSNAKITFDQYVEENGIIYGVIYNSKVTMTDASAFTVTKKKTGTDIVVAGAIIGVFDENDNKIGEAATNAEGQIGISGLEAGRYYYQEISAPAGYILNSEKYYFTVENNGTVTFAEGTNQIIYNDRVTMTAESAFTVTKKRTGTNAVVEGAVIGVYNEDGNKIGEAITNAEGQIGISGLEVGRYYYQETVAPIGYVLNSEKYYFTVENDGTVTLEEGTNQIIYNDRVILKDALTIVKRKAGTDISLEGATIGVFDATGNKLEEKTTGADGIVSFEGLETGSYYYQEITPPIGYALNNTEYHFTVENDGTIILAEGANQVIYNSRVRMKAESAFAVTKKKTGTNAVVEGAVIGIYGEDGNKVVEKTTNAEGQIIISDLEVGRYYYQETAAPLGYILNSEKYYFIVENDGTVTLEEGTNQIIYNDRVTMKETLTVVKKRTGTDIVLQGATIGVFDTTGIKVVEKTTGIDGTVSFANLESGGYYYQELRAPLGYSLNSSIYSFVVEEDGSVTYANNTNGIIYDDPIRMEVDVPIYKVDKITNAKIKGAIIEIYNADGTAITQETTDENGVVIFKDLSRGKRYTYKEKQAPVGYKMNTETYAFIVNEDGTITYEGETGGIIYDEPIYVTITKKDIVTGRVLTGAVIGIYDEEGKRIVEGTTNEEGQIVFGGFGIGKTYKYKEEKAPIGYQVDERMYTFKITEEGDVVYEKGTEGVIYNERMRINVPVYKMEKGTKVALAGAVIGIYDETGKALTNAEGKEIVVRTNIEGVAVFEGLEVGKVYQYKEKEAPTGYNLNETVYMFRITEEGNVIYDSSEGIIYDEKITVQMTNPVLTTKLPQTGINTVALGVLMTLTGVSVVGTIYYKKKIK